MGSGGVGLRNRSGVQIRRQPRAPTPRGAGFAPARPGAKSRASKRQSILTVGLHDRALPASLGDGQLRGAPGTIGLIHDLLTELVVTSLLAQTGEGLGHVLRFHLLARGGSLGGRQPGGGKAQRVRVELQQSGLRRGSYFQKQDYWDQLPSLSSELKREDATARFGAGASLLILSRDTLFCLYSEVSYPGLSAIALRGQAAT